MQSLVHQAFQRCGHLWNRTDILLKISEEVGELVRAYRKEASGNQLWEFGDLLFSILALAEREDIDAYGELHRAVVRFEKYCNQIAGKENQIREDRERVNAGGYCQQSAFEPAAEDTMVRSTETESAVRSIHELPGLTVK
jgi:NTP pyrophosphatase (non-canonical NTP hydrolase)